MRQVLFVMWTAIALAVTADSFNGVGYTTSGAVVQGEFTSQYAKAKAYAEENRIPLVAVWVNPGCGWCEALEAALASKTVGEWMKKRGYVFVIGIGGMTSEADEVFDFTVKYEFPGCRVRWKRPDGTFLDSKSFPGRLGEMPVTTGTTTARQFMDSVDKYAEGYAGPVKKYADVTFDPAGGTSVAAKRVKIGASVGTLPRTEREGHVFKGWYTENDPPVRISSATRISADVTFRAQWTPTCRLTVLSADDAMGSAKGSKTAVSNTYVKVLATARKGNVFAGWYLDKSCKKPATAYMKSGDCRKSGDYFLTPAESCEIELYARFIDKGLDALEVDCPANWQVDTAQASSFFSLDVQSQSLPTLSAKSLPAGIKVSGSSLVVSDSSKLKPGTKEVTLTVKNASGMKTVKKVVVRIPNLQAPEQIKVDSSDAGYVLRVGVPIGTALSGVKAAEGWSLTVSGLPSGVKWDSKNQVFVSSSVPTKACTNTVTFVARKSGSVAKKATATMCVQALPTWAYGTYDGFGEGTDMGSGRLSVTVSKTGKLSGTFRADGKTWTLSAKAYSSYDSGKSRYVVAMTGKNGRNVVTNDFVMSSLDPSRGIFQGDGIRAYQRKWSVSPWKELARTIDRTDDLSYEDDDPVPGAITLRFGASGAVTAKGSFVIGRNAKTGKDIRYSASCSTQLCAIDDRTFLCVVCFSPKTGKFDGYVRCLELTWTGDRIELK